MNAAAAIALTLSGIALLVALVSVFISLWAVGRMAQLTTRLRDVDVKLASLTGQCPPPPHPSRDPGTW